MVAEGAIEKTFEILNLAELPEDADAVTVSLSVESMEVLEYKDYTEDTMSVFGSMSVGEILHVNDGTVALKVTDVESVVHNNPIVQALRPDAVPTHGFMKNASNIFQYSNFKASSTHRARATGVTYDGGVATIAAEGLASFPSASGIVTIDGGKSFKYTDLNLAQGTIKVADATFGFAQKNSVLTYTDYTFENITGTAWQDDDLIILSHAVHDYELVDATSMTIATYVEGEHLREIISCRAMSVPEGLSASAEYDVDLLGSFNLYAQPPRLVVDGSEFNLPSNISEPQFSRRNAIIMNEVNRVSLHQQITASDNRTYYASQSAGELQSVYLFEKSSSRIEGEALISLAERINGTVDRIKYQYDVKRNDRLGNTLAYAFEDAKAGEYFRVAFGKVSLDEDGNLKDPLFAQSNILRGRRLYNFVKGLSYVTMDVLTMKTFPERRSSARMVHHILSETLFPLSWKN